jgi:putative SOS response-associated peptidase YedK
MCGRYDLNESPHLLALWFNLAAEPSAYANPDVRPGDAAPVIRLVDGRRLAVPARWGLIPSWAKDDSIARHTFNARGETVSGKPSFQAAFRRRRCIVPVSAFFEWQAVPGERKKRKFRLAGADGHPLAIAGLWERWTRPETGEAVDSFTVITTGANGVVAPIHDRMPVILAAHDWDAWLDPETANPLLLQSMLAPCPDEVLAVEG